MYRLIDSHCHLEELENIESAIEKAKNQGVIAVVAVGQDYESNCRILEIASKYESYVYPALGLYPGRLPADVLSIDRELRFIEDHIGDIVAIGEVGLDYKKELIKRAGKDWQKYVFRNVLELAARYEKPVSVHSRYSWRDCFTLVQQSRVEKVVFHWYTGPSNVLRDILKQGYFISATLAAEYHYEHRRAVKETPLDRLMLETDSPVMYRGYKAGPADVVRSLEAASSLKEVTSTIIASMTTENAVGFFGLTRDLDV